MFKVFFFVHLPVITFWFIISSAPLFRGIRVLFQINIWCSCCSICSFCVVSTIVWLFVIFCATIVSCLFQLTSSDYISFGIFKKSLMIPSSSCSTSGTHCVNLVTHPVCIFLILVFSFILFLDGYKLNVSVSLW